MRTCGWYPMKVLCSQEVVSSYRCVVVPCQVTVQASAPPGAVVCPLLVTPVGRLGGYGTVQCIDFYALSCGSFRKQARNLIETAQRKSQSRTFMRFYPIVWECRPILRETAESGPC